MVINPQIFLKSQYFLLCDLSASEGSALGVRSVAS